MKNNIVSFIVGVLFSLGLGVSGMTQPQKVIGFLDLLAWDPSLLLVMAGAIGTHALVYHFARRRKAPLFDQQWHVPTRNDVTPKLLIGAAIFGVGWGIGGYCPGPALVSLVSGELNPWIFVFSMMAGMRIFISAEKLLHKRKSSKEKKWKSRATLPAL